jgi:hypothetical protein
MRRKPRILWFACRKPAVSSGETTVYDGQAVLERMPVAMRSQFLTRRIVYTQSYPRRLWPTLFRTESLDEVTELCRRKGVELKIDEDETGEAVVHTRYACSALQPDRFGRSPAFANHILPSVDAERRGFIFPTAMKVRWEDHEEPFSHEFVLDLLDTVEELARPVPAHAGE